jgi:hypothetical protein
MPNPSVVHNETAETFVSIDTLSALAGFLIEGKASIIVQPVNGVNAALAIEADTLASISVPQGTQVQELALTLTFADFVTA